MVCSVRRLKFREAIRAESPTTRGALQRLHFPRFEAPHRRILGDNFGMRHWLAATFILIGCKSNSDKSGATNQPPSGGQATNAALGSGTTTTGNADATAARGASSGSNGSNSGSNGALAEAPVPSGLAGPVAGTAVTTVGAAYLGIRDVGIVQLAAGKATTVVEHRFTLQDLAQLPNGEVVVIGIGGMWRLQKGKATSLDGNDKNFEQLAVSHKGAIWATGYPPYSEFNS